LFLSLDGMEQTELALAERTALVICDPRDNPSQVAAVFSASDAEADRQQLESGRLVFSIHARRDVTVDLKR
jgi:hypothetical protein